MNIIMNKTEKTDYKIVIDWLEGHKLQDISGVLIRFITNDELVAYLTQK